MSVKHTYQPRTCYDFGKHAACFGNPVSEPSIHRDRRRHHCIRFLAGGVRSFGNRLPSSRLNCLNEGGTHTNYMEHFPQDQAMASRLVSTSQIIKQDACLMPLKGPPRQQFSFSRHKGKPGKTENNLEVDLDLVEGRR